MTGSAAGAPDSSAARKVADALGDRYKVISKLGVGAFGEVYRARDTILERAVAIKRIRLNACDDPEGLDELKQRFMREAQVAAQLQHPNIVTVYDIVSTPDMTCIVMELLDGTSLKWMLASKKRLDLPRAIDILSQVAEALDYAHQQKVVHRDVKPANIMITASGQVKVTDFGIAKIESSTNLTASGSIVGTPNYMSPEQARGEDVDGRSDLFSLGCVLYECLAGQKPFRSSNLTGVLMGIVYDEPSPIDWEKVGLPAAVQRVVRGALAKDPAQRFASGAELVQALRSIPSADRAAEKGRLEKTLVDLAPVQETRGQGSVEETADRTSDSVADVLMISARRTKRIKRYLKALLKEERRLRAVSSPLLLFRNVSLTSDEAFVLSRIDGHHPPRYIFSLSPLSDTQTARTLVGLLRAGIIELEEEPEPAEAQATEEPASSDEAVRQEIEQLFELCQQQDHWQVLGLERDAGLEEIKRAFHEKVFRYHPDHHRQISDPGFHKKLSYVFSRLDDAFTTLSRKVEVNSQPKLAEKAPPRPPAPREAEAEEPPNNDGDHREARDLFRRAKKAFEKKDYWGTIVHCRYAIQFADDQAEYFHLLGLALAQNRQWRQEAEENLKIATDLDPSKPEYFGALGELYRDEGLDVPARRMFEKAKGIDPNYQIPDER